MVSALVQGSGPDVISFWPSSGDLVLKLDYRERKHYWFIYHLPIEDLASISCLVD